MIYFICNLNESLLWIVENVTQYMEIKKKSIFSCLSRWGVHTNLISAIITFSVNFWLFIELYPKKIQITTIPQPERHYMISHQSQILNDMKDFIA